MKRILRRILDALYTRPCVLCGKPVKASEEINLCKRCTGKSALLGRTFEVSGNVTTCALPYSGHSRNAMIKFKFRNKKYYGFTFAELIYRRLCKYPWMSEIDCVVCVPMRGRKRLYNQAAVIAEGVAARLDVPFSEDALVKVKDNPPFYKLKRKERLGYIKDAFRVKDPDFISGRTVLLIDDIYTTGTTVGECTRTLLSGGAGKVYSATVCYRLI